MAKVGRPEVGQKKEVLAWMKAEDKGYTAAARHFGLSISRVKGWVDYERKKLPSASSTPAPSGPAPVTRSRMEQVNAAIDLRLQELLSPERIKAEQTSVIVDVLVKLATLFKLAPSEEGQDDGSEAVASVLSLVRKSS